MIPSACSDHSLTIQTAIIEIETTLTKHKVRFLHGCKVLTHDTGWLVLHHLTRLPLSRVASRCLLL